ncbi:MAG: VOC family protein, partial [Gammaproteobacteria bacterium]
ESQSEFIYRPRRSSDEVTTIMKLQKVLVLAAFIAAGCTAINVDLPAVSDVSSGTRSVGSVVWHDLLTNDPEGSRRFYSELFGWEFERPGINVGFGDGSGYMLIRHDGELIGGMVDANQLGREGNISQWITVISVDDIDAAVDAVRSQNGSVLTPPTELPTRGTLAVAADQDGAIFALVRTRGGDPPEREPVVNRWIWNELWTADVNRAANFYGSVAGYAIEPPRNVQPANDYRVLETAGNPRAGIMDNPFGDDTPPVWVNYLRVEDPAAITARVEQLGGRVIVDARPRDVGGTAAFIAGPSGAGIALQTWPLD